MSKIKGIADQFAQRASIEFVPVMVAPAVDSIQFPSTHAATDRTGLIIEEVEYSFDEAAMEPADGELFCFGLSFIPPALTWTRDGQTGILHHNSFLGQESAAPVYHKEAQNVVKSFTHLTGGGILVHPSSLFFWTLATGGYAVGGGNKSCTIWYKAIDLSEDMYRELWELRLIAQGI